MSLPAVQPKIYGLSDRPLARVREFLTFKDQALFSRVCKKWKTNLAEYQARYLNPRQRPYDIRKKIDDCFSDLVSDEPKWNFNGCSRYSLCGINEHKLALKLILDGYPSRKDFYFMDVGAGDFQWGEALAKFINSQKLSEDITVHIISVRGERHYDLSRIKEGRCVRYNLGAFKIEDMQNSLNREGFPRNQPFLDGVFTSWCLRHLVDPTQVAKEVIDMLRPETGVFLGDGFYTLRNFDVNPERGLDKADSRMVQLLATTKAPFLIKEWGDRHLNQFILRRPNKNPCELPLKYVGIYQSGREGTNASGCVVIFKETDYISRKFLEPKDSLCGSRSLYEWLYKNEVFFEDTLSWKPIRESEAIRKNSPLHEAVLLGDLDEVAKCVRKSNIDDPNAEGETAVALAIKGCHDDILKFLIAKGANVRLADNNSCTPLHKAVESTRSEIYVPLLLESGADANAVRGRALTRAIELKKTSIVALLLAHGAKISKISEERLRDPVFKALGKLRFSPPTFYGEQDTIRWLEMGDCVLLRQGWETTVFYKGSEPPSLEDVRVIGIDLEDDAMIERLKKEGYYPRTTEFAKTIGLRENIPHAYLLDARR